MSTSDSFNYELIDQLAEEFAVRYRQGERPALQEFIDRHPDQAEAIRELLPAMVQMEQAKDDVGAEPVVTANPPQFDRLGDFRILREIGHGGMGIVYEAEQESLGRRVALKVLPKKMLLEPKQKRRFEREAKAAAKLHHTNIVPVFGVFEHEGMPYYVMQFIQGHGLDQVLEELRRLQPAGPTATFPRSALQAESLPRPTIPAARVAQSLLTGQFEPTLGADSVVEGAVDQIATQTSSSISHTALSGSSVSLPGQRGMVGDRRPAPTYWHSVAHIGVQVASALDYAHQQGIIHRDIKPSNLLLDTRAVVWVTDFGLAKTDDQQNLTNTGDILGTLRYMPPEAFEGRTDARSDVYSLGLTLYEMLVLRPAFGERDKHKLIKQVTAHEATRLDRLNRLIPRDLVTIVHKAIDREPNARYATAGEMAADLQRFIDDEPIRARPISTFERLSRWARHNRGVAASLVATFLVILVGLGLVTWKWQDERRARSDANESLSRVEKLAEEKREQLEKLGAANDRLEAGRNFMREGAYGKAREAFTEAIRLHPEHSSAWNERGQLYCHLGLWERAAPDVLQAFKLQPPSDRYRTRFRYAYFHWRDGNIAEYRRTCNEMLRDLKPDDRSENAFWAVLSACLAPNAVDHPEQIVRAAQRHIQRHPRNSVNVFQLAIAHFRAGQYGIAQQVLQEANTSISRGDIMLTLTLAMSHFKQGNQVEAMKVMGQIAVFFEQLVWDADSRGFMAKNEGETWEGRAMIEALAKEAAETIVKRRDYQTIQHIVRARAFVELDEAGPAAEEYAKAVALEPKHGKLRRECFKFYATHKKWEKAEHELAAITSLDSNDPQIHLDALCIYADQGQWEKATAQHARAIQMRPTDSRIALEIWRFHAERGQWSDAEKAFAEQLKRQPGQAAALHIECANFYREAKLWNRAAIEFAEVVKHRPDDVWDAWYPYAVLCLKARRREEYQKIGIQLMERFRHTTDATLAWRIAVICKLAHRPSEETTQVLGFLRARQPRGDGVLGHCLYRNQQYQEAIDMLLKSIPNTQNISHIWDKYFLAMAYAELDRSVEAERWLLEANQSIGDEKSFADRVTRWDMRLDLQMLREEAELLVFGNGQTRSRIRVHMTRSEWKPALELSDELQKTETLTRRDHRLRGRCYAGLKQWDRALKEYDKAIELGMDNYAIWYQRAEAQNYLRQWTGALESLARAEKWQAGTANLFHYRASALLGLGRYDEAVAAADRCLELGASSAWTRHHRASALMKLQRFDEATKDWNDFLRIITDHQESWMQRGKCFAICGKWQEAIADFDKARKLNSENSLYWYSIAAAHLGAGKIDAHRTACADMLRHFRDTKSPLTASRIAYVCVAVPNAGADKNQLNQLAQLGVGAFPGNERILAAVLYRSGDYDSAIQQFDKAVEKHPRKAWDWLFLAMCHHHSNRPVQARECLANAEKWIAEANKKQNEFDPKLTWVDWYERVEVELLRQEAGKQINPKT